MTGDISTPIFQTSTYAQSGPGEHKGFEYGRTHNPTRAAFEQNIATLESGKFGFAFASGMAATATVAQLFKAGDHIVSTKNVYGGPYRFFTQLMQNFGLTASWVDTSNIENIQAAVTANTKMVFIETPTNPMLVLSDLRKVADFCKNRGLIMVVDNTFLSPYFQRPLEFGADIVIHSTTKYINGHGDTVGGIIVTNNEELAERIGWLQNAAGAVPGPFDCWLMLRATKTLPLRMKTHAENAKHIAKFLLEQPFIENVVYPDLPSHPQHELAKMQHKTSYGNYGSGGMITFFVKDFATAQKIMRRMKLFTVAESLGGVESLACHPPSMTHASVPPEIRREIGVSDGLVRLSVGIEDVDDLIRDLQNSFQGI